MKRIKLFMIFLTVVSCSIFLLVKNSVCVAKQINDSCVCSMPVEEDFDIVAAKKQLVSEHANELQNMSEDEIDAELTSIENILFSNEYSAEVENQLNARGAYVLEQPENASYLKATTASDFMLEKPKLIYSSSTGQWGIYVCGHFTKQLDILAELTFASELLLVNDALKQRVGGTEMMGFYFVNVKDGASYNDADAVLRSTKAYTGSEASSGSKYAQTTSNFAYGTSSSGIIFEMQDRLHILLPYLTTTVKYDCQYFGCIAWYNSSFVNFDAHVYSYYLHTYCGCDINDFSLSVTAKGTSFEPKVDFAFLSRHNNWPAQQGDTGIKEVYKEGSYYRSDPGSWQYYPSKSNYYQLDSALKP